MTGFSMKENERCEKNNNLPERILTELQSHLQASLCKRMPECFTDTNFVFLSFCNNNVIPSGWDEKKTKELEV